MIGSGRWCLSNFFASFCCVVGKLSK
jgi:hypothetical protein